MIRRPSRRRRSRSRRLRKTRRQRGGGGRSVDLVIAHYKEDLHWLGKPPFNQPYKTVHLYTKAEEPQTLPSCPVSSAPCKISRLPNVGVCDHTYLHHIYTNYDTLADITVFLPASASLPHKIERAKKIVATAFEKGVALVPAIERPRPVHEHSANFTLTRWVTSEESNRTPGESYFHAPASPRPFGAWYKGHFPGVSTRYETNAGIFAATREMIHRRPRSFYKSLLDEVSKHRFHEASHFIERSWSAIFDPLPAESVWALHI